MENARGVLTVEGLRKSYGGKPAVEALTFTVGRNEIVGLLGPNGAGKTTTINMILGVLEPDGGTIEIEGKSLARERRRALGCTNFAAVYAPLPGNLTVRQNLRVFGLIYKVRQLGARVEALLDQFELRRFADESKVTLWLFTPSVTVMPSLSSPKTTRRCRVEVEL